MNIKNLVRVFSIVVLVFSAFFVNSASASAQGACGTDEVKLFDSGENVYCAPDANNNGSPDFAEAVSATPSWMTTFVEGQNNPVPNSIPTGFALNNLLGANTYRHQLFVESNNLIHEPTADINFTEPIMVTLDVPQQLTVTLEPGQSFLTWNTQRQEIVLYHNPNPSTSDTTFQTQVTDAGRGWTEVNEDLFSFWFVRMLSSEWTRLPSHFEVVLVS